MFSQNFRVSAKSQLHNTRSKYQFCIYIRLHKSIFKNETTDKFPKRLDFYFPSLSSQFQERILISYILLTTILQKRKNNKIQENNIRKSSKLHDQNSTRISAFDISSIFPVIPTSSVLFLKQTATQGFRPPFNRASIFAPPHLNIGCGRLFPSRSQRQRCNTESITTFPQNPPRGRNSCPGIRFETHPPASRLFRDVEAP